MLNKKIKLKRPLILSRHNSHSVLRGILDLQPFRAIIRLGSTTTKEQVTNRLKKDYNSCIEINNIQGIKNSSNKLLMKECFNRASVKTAIWMPGHETQETLRSWADRTGFPIVAKSHYGSRGVGNTKLDNVQSFQTFLERNNKSNYIFEKFYTYSKEYRIHVTNDGCFYTCRKLLKNTAPEGTWQLHDDGNVVWIVEENEKFKKPTTWNLIVQDCINAKNALGLDICSFDVMVQGSSKTNPEWIIVESQSAPSFGSITGEKYKIELNKLLNSKGNNG